MPTLLSSFFINQEIQVYKSCKTNFGLSPCFFLFFFLKKQAVFITESPISFSLVALDFL